MSGLIPAIPLIVIRPFLPESPKWSQKKLAGTLRRPSIAELFSPDLRRTTLVTTAMFACSYGVAFGAIQQMPQIVPGINVVKEEVDERASKAKEKAVLRNRNRQREGASTKRRPRLPERAACSIRQEKVAEYTKAQELGGPVRSIRTWQPLSCFLPAAEVYCVSS